MRLATYLDLVTTFILKEDDPLLNQSFDTKRISLGLNVYGGKPKYIMVFDPVLSTSYALAN